VGEVFRVLGYRDLITLVGHDLQGLGILGLKNQSSLSWYPRWSMYPRRLDWFFNPKNGSQDPRSDEPHTRVFHSGIPLEVFHVGLQ
jgi:hypothetical protein